MDSLGLKPLRSLLAQNSIEQNASYGILALVTAWLVTKLVTWLDDWRHRKGRPSPHPPRHWLLGNVPALAKHLEKGDHLDKLIAKWMPEYGKIFTLKLGPMNFTVVCDPDSCKEVLATHNWPKSPTYSGLHPFIGERSMLVAPAHTWSKQRSSFNPAFQYAFLKGLVPVFVDKTRLMVANLERLAGSGQVIKLHETAALLTLDIICEVAISKNFHMQEGNEKPELFRLFSDLVDDCAYWNDRPHLYWMRHIPFLHASIHRMQRQLDKLLMGVIDEEVTRGSTSPGADAVAGAVDNADSPSRGVTVGPAARNILQLALATARSEGGALDRLDVLSQVKTFLFAGHDTTATTVAMAIYELSRHPAAEARLLAEVHAAMHGSAEPSVDALGQMRFMGAVIKEVLRLWPPGGTARLAPRGATLKGFDVGGHVIYVPHYPLHRDPDVWGPDAAEFRPERWMDEETKEEAEKEGRVNVSKLHAYAYQPFSKGPRDCIGQTFALLEAKAVLAMLLPRFKFEYAGTEPEDMAYKIVSHPKFGVPVTVQLRTQ